MTPLEKDIERALVRMVKNRGGLCLKWVCPGWAGVPDRIVLLPGGRVVFVELKRKGGQVGDLQAWWEEKLTDLGFVHWTIWSHEDLKRFENIILQELKA